MKSKRSLADLERVAAMYDDGWLTDDEYYQEKNLILYGAPARVPRTELDGEKSTKIAVALVLAVLVAAGAVWWMGLIARSSSNSGVGLTKPPVTPVKSTSALPKAESTPAVVLDEAVKFADPAECVAAPTLDKIYESMMPFSKSTGEILPSRSVKVGPFQLTPQVRNVVAADDPPGTIAKEATVRMPKKATWHGLQLSRLKASNYAPPDADSSYSRAMTFLSSPSEVQKALRTLGFNTPLPGAHSQLTDDVCGGSLMIVPIAGGTELICSWGC